MNYSNLFQPELVEYYYLWKKTPGANNNRPHRRRRQGSLRRIRTTRATRPSSAQKDEASNFQIHLLFLLKLVMNNNHLI